MYNHKIFTFYTEFVVRRAEDFGGNTTYASFDELQAAFAKEVKTVAKF